MRRFVPASVFVLLAAVAAGCGGTSSTAVTPPVARASATLTAGASAATATVLDPSGYAATVTLQPTSDGSSGSVALRIATSLPAGIPVPASVARRTRTIGVPLAPLAYVFVTPTANVTFSTSAALTFTLPGGTSLAAGSSASVGFYDPGQSATGWVALGTASVSGRTVAFAGTPGLFTLKAGTTYAFALLAATQPVTATLSGPLLAVDLTHTGLAPTTKVNVYIVGAIKTNPGVSYWLKPLASSTQGTNVNQPVVAATMNPGSQNPKVTISPVPNAANCANNGDDTNFWACNNNGLDGLSSGAAAAINGGGGTGGNYPSAWADYSIAATVGTTLTMNLSAISAIPGLGTGTSAFSGRVYISVGVPKLPITPIAGGTYVSPSFGNNAGQPGEWTLYDWIEFSYDSKGSFNGNTTQVNAFGFPMQLEANGTNPPQVLMKSRSAILSDVAKMPWPYGGTGQALGNMLVAIPSGAESAYPANAQYIRAIAPQTIVAVGAYPAAGPLRTTFDDIIAGAYRFWQSTPLVTNDQSTGPFTGVVFPTNPAIPTPSGYPAGSLAFYPGSFTSMSQFASSPVSRQTPAFYLTGSGENPGNQNVISSTDIWANDNSLAPPAPAPTPQGNVGKMLAAAFNRGIIEDPATGVFTSSLDDSTCSGSAVVRTFYPGGGTFNPWAQYFHSITAPIGTNPAGLAYAFSYDDVCNQNPSISVTPGTITIAVGPF